MNIEQIIEAFTQCDKTYKLEVVNAAIEQKEAITPHLINILKQILTIPKQYLEDKESFFYRVDNSCLFAYFENLMLLSIISLTYQRCTGTGVYLERVCFVRFCVVSLFFQKFFCHLEGCGTVISMYLIFFYVW